MSLTRDSVVGVGGKCLAALMRHWQLRDNVSGELAAWLLAAGVAEEAGDGLRLSEAGRRLFLALGLLLERPRYDAAGRALRWRGAVVKRLEREAPAQSAVLAAFEAAGWTERIDDPLGEEQLTDAKERLRETVRNLNRGLESGTVRFRADGTGRGVRWESAG